MQEQVGCVRSGSDQGSADYDYDIIIVGAGPAGSTCAWFAAQAGLRVALMDGAVFPRDKVCGDALSRTKVWPLLQEMGVAESFDELPMVPCRDYLVVAPSGGQLRVTASREENALSGANRICRRRVFDQRLLEHAASKADVLQAFTVTDVARVDGAVEVTGHERATGRQRRLRGAVVVGADGAQSVVAARAGLRDGSETLPGIALRGWLRHVEPPRDCLELYFLAPLLPGYLWIFPSEDGTVNVGVGIFRGQLARMRVGLDEVFWRLIKGHPVLAERFRDAALLEPLQGWPLPLWSRRRRLSADGVLLAGDAAGLVDPLTGEGIGNAMLSGKIAAAVAGEALRSRDASARFLRRYDARLWQMMGREFLLARLLQRVIARPWAVNAVVRCARLNGAFARLVHSVILAPGGKQDLLSLRGLRRIVGDRHVAGRRI